jgi:hypothetical protein
MLEEDDIGDSGSLRLPWDWDLGTQVDILHDIFDTTPSPPPASSCPPHEPLYWLDPRSPSQSPFTPHPPDTFMVSSMRRDAYAHIPSDADLPPKLICILRSVTMQTDPDI